MKTQKNDVTSEESGDFFVIFAHAALFHFERWIEAGELGGMSYLTHIPQKD